jgi:hypothetical protein
MTQESAMKPANSRILTINGGLSSIKFALYPTGAQSEQRLYGKVDRIGLSGMSLTFNGPTGNRQGRHSLDELVQLANQERIVVVFAEAVLWRCHRSLIAEALLVRGIRTKDIMNPTRPHVHTLNPFAKVRGTTITYPAEDSQSAQTESRVKHAGSQPVKRARSHSD